MFLGKQICWGWGWGVGVWHERPIFIVYLPRDKDQDRTPGANCAQLFKGGWWFNYCHFWPQLVGDVGYDKPGTGKIHGISSGNYCHETQYPGTGSGAPFTCWYKNLIHPPHSTLQSTWINWKEAKMTLKLK